MGSPLVFVDREQPRKTQKPSPVEGPEIGVDAVGVNTPDVSILVSGPSYFMGNGKVSEMFMETKDTLILLERFGFP
jgi:hypothetical protein